MSKRLDGIKGYKYKTSSWQGLGAFRFFFKKQKKRTVDSSGKYV